MLLAELVFEPAESSLAQRRYAERHVSALPRKWFVKFRTRRFRGNVADVPASAITIPEAPVSGMSGSIL